MRKLVILAAMAMALTGCGGGGGGGANTTKYDIHETATIETTGNTLTATNTARTLLSIMGSITTNNAFIPSLASGEFTGDGKKYVVLSGWINASTTAPSVKIYQLNSDGTSIDATSSILGGAFAISVNYPLIADFNRDGIDDIFFPGFTDGPGVAENVSVAFLSRSGQSHLRVDVPGLTSSHASVAVDLNNDGYLDVINSMGYMWINNRANGFANQVKFNYTSVADPIGGNGICSGDFDGSGQVQLVVTDIMANGELPIQDTYIFKLNSSMQPTKVGVLPVPYFDRTSTTTEISHDVSCVVTDLNNDGRQDIVVVSANNSASVQQGLAPHSSVVQVYLNQGNFVFTDATDTALSGYTSNVLSSYTPKIIDFNGDGKPDIWLMDWDNQGVSANQIWINNGSAVFAQKNRNSIESMISEFKILTSGESGHLGIMLPIKIDGKWNFVVTDKKDLRTFVGYGTTQWTF